MDNSDKEQREYIGVLHIHTRYSDGHGTVRDIVEAAKKTDIDFVVISDHDTMKAKDEGEEGWHDNILVIVGTEFSPKRPNAGHALVLGLDQYDCDYDDRNPEHEPLFYLQRFYRNGAYVFLAHPSGKKGPFDPHAKHEWDLENIDTYHGIELWSYMHDWIQGYKPWKILDYLINRDSKISGPSLELLQLWDRLCRRRSVPIIGALDSHSYRIPLTPIRVFPYEFEFRTVRTHVLCPPLTKNDKADEQTILRAFVEGSCFVAYDRFANSTGFRFWFEQEDGDEVQMGAERLFKKQGTLRIKLPDTADLTVFRNGKPIEKKFADELSVPVSQAGVYRAEVRRDGRPWIFSNPIYLRER